MAWIKAIPYIIVGGLIVALLLLVLYFRSEYKDANQTAARLSAQNDGLLKINADQGAAVARLTNQLTIDEKFTKDFADTLSQINAQTAQASADLAGLKTNDPDAKTFLDTRIPDSVRKLLDNGKAGGSANNR